MLKFVDRGKGLIVPLFISFAGSAVGFRLDILLRLSDTHAHNNKMTLMCHLCKVYNPFLISYVKIIFNKLFLNCLSHYNYRF